MHTEDYGDLRVVFVDPDGPLISTGGQANDLIGDAWGSEATVIAVPVERLDPAFFELRSGLAGEIAQKVVNYRLRLVVVGDTSVYEARSSALRDWIWESNRGTQVWFVPDRAALAARLTTP
ncbi:DUF4180 domain-containing protein [Amnibacterium flavum]|uniref:DUF4180 domain-containing protein n=1 Tax=Amnibacterium flavum TaxID=2173173 RepID=A0A2V1HRK2_9MICO|nr:DUF4180 domain-containing protein [Amnibacterium flavum]PVZ93739.1 DUF4180 domain-containing protein [Amnibacterium flavum]